MSERAIIQRNLKGEIEVYDSHAEHVKAFTKLCLAWRGEQLKFPRRKRDGKHEGETLRTSRHS